MKGTALARRYAVALADVAEQEGILERVRDEMDALAGALTDSRQFDLLVNLPLYGREAVAGVFRAMGEKLELSGPVRRLLEHMAAGRRTGIIPDLAQGFAREADRRLGICAATVTSAVELTDDQKRRIVEKLERMTQRRVRLRQDVDASLIAGLRIHVDGACFDGGLRGRLERLREKLIHAD